MVSTYIVLYKFHKHYPYLVINCFDSFGVGALYAYIRLDKEKCKQFEQYFYVFFPLMLFIAWRLGPYSGFPVCVIYTRFLESVTALALIILVINNTSELARKYLWENTFFNFIGKISYGIYLYHFILGPAYDEGIKSWISGHPSAPSFIGNVYFSYCIKLTLLILICWLSFRIIEQPILRLKKRFEYK